MAKAELRRQLKAERAEVPPERRAVWDAQIRRFLAELPAYQGARRIMTYLSIGWEVDTWGIVAHLEQLGREILRSGGAPGTPGPGAHALYR